MGIYYRMEGSQTEGGARTVRWSARTASRLPRVCIDHESPLVCLDAPLEKKIGDF